MIEFELVSYNDLGRDHLKKYSTWAQYYEPDDIESLVEFGFDRELVTSEIEKSGWSDNNWFPVPDETSLYTFQFEKRKAIFKTESGKVLSGYVINDGYAIGLFGAKEDWGINLNLLDWHEKELDKLKIDLGLEATESLLPLEVEIPFKNVKFNFPEGPLIDL